MASSPQILVPLAKDMKSVAIETHLLQDRMVFFGEEVNNESANACVQKLLVLAAQDAKAPITLYINSPGGSVIDGMGIYDTIRAIAPPVHAVVCGMAASMGAVILSGCEKGQRAIMPHGEVLLHQPLGGARGPATDIKIGAERILKTKETLLRVLAENCGQSYEKLVEDCDRDYWLDAEEAVAYGICDYVYGQK
ncbi:MAG: ATP-dependent Clp protease proteolytic subunit [Planctomycetota bacterium]|nr:MAG: ATP-dependent Clp protease proteolytic subunit [Planctomycetota bacterium]